MKRTTNYLIYILAFTAILHFSCEKNADTATASPTTGGAGGSLARFAIWGNYLYMVTHSTLEVFDIADAAKPVKRGTAYVGNDIETIFPYKDKLFLGGRNGMYIYTLADPVKPVREGLVTHFRACDPVVSNDSVSYVTLRSFATTCGVSPRNVLNIYDVKNLKAPTLIHTVDLKSPYGLGIKQKGLYVCQGANGLSVFDLANPYSPSWKKDFKDEIYFDVIPYGNVLIAYVEQGVCFYDIADPLNPVLLSKLKS